MSLCKVSSLTKHNGHCTIGFFIFLCEEYILFLNVYISMNTISKCCYLFFGWEICHPLSTCAIQGMEGGGVIQNVYRFIQEERGITPHVYLCTYRQLLFSCICLKVSCSSVVRHSTKICVKKMKEKYVTFTVGKSKFLQNQRGDGDFSAENLDLFFQSSGNVKLSPETERISCLTNCRTS